MTTYAVAPARGNRRIGTRILWPLGRWLLLAVYLAALVTTALLGTRESSYADLMEGLSNGTVTHVRIENAMGGPGGLVHDEQGTASVRLVWQDGWHRSVAVVTQATSQAELDRTGTHDGPTIIGRVDTPLQALAPHTTFEWGHGPGSWSTVGGWELYGRLGLLPVVALGLFLVVVVLGPEPRWATPWAWFWIALSPAFVLAVPAYLVATLRPADPMRRRLNGWVALVLCLFVLPRATLG